ncbi:flavodoxin family protein [Candidatus Poribacteria bacterium]|nr:flavodoxin family protein [Candidatus Poribacteria bacterium]
MNALIISGSRDLEGRTAQAMAALAEGLEAEGATCDTVFLPAVGLERCRQCDDDGWGECRAEGSCVIEDDFARLVAAIRAADMVAFATPVYYGDLSESIRAFLDRLRRICTHENGEHGIVGTPAVGICVAGGGGGGGPKCAVSLEGVLQTIGFDVADMVPARRQNLDLKLDVLRVTGRWLAQVADETDAQ